MILYFCLRSLLLTNMCDRLDAAFVFSCRYLCYSSYQVMTPEHLEHYMQSYLGQLGLAGAACVVLALLAGALRNPAPRNNAGAGRCSQLAHFR